MNKKPELLTLEQILHVLKEGPEMLVPLFDIVHASLEADTWLRGEVEYRAIAHIGAHQHRGWVVRRLTQSLRIINILPHPKEVQ